MIDTIKEICKERKIKLVPYRDLFEHRAFADKDWDCEREFTKKTDCGFAWRSSDSQDELRAIFYDDEAAPDRLMCTLAHEMGHHVLGHLSYRRNEFENEAAKRGDYKESEARIFSVVIMAMSLYDEIKQRNIRATC